MGSESKDSGINNHAESKMRNTYELAIKDELRNIRSCIIILTDGGGVVRSAPAREALAAGDDSLSDAIPDERKILHLLRDRDILAIHAGFDVDHEARL